MRWLVSTLPATTADGLRAFDEHPSGAQDAHRRVGAGVGRDVGGRAATRRAKEQAERVTASGQLTLPRTAAAVPSKSMSTLVAVDRHRDADRHVVVGHAVALHHALGR